MLVKSGRLQFNLTSTDEILYNGSCYQITTRTYKNGFDTVTPRIANTLAKSLIKNGDLVVDRVLSSDFGHGMTVYKIAGGLS